MKGWQFLIATAIAIMATQCRGLLGPASAPPAPSTPPAGTSLPAAPEAFVQGVKRFQEATSFKFTVQATHRWVFEGQEREWLYKGEGAWGGPDRFYSSMQGPADTQMWIKIIGSRISGGDARGDRGDVGTAFGGPGKGAAPYTVISYLKNYDQVSSLGLQSIEGVETQGFRFIPRVSQVAALDTAHASALSKVKAVEGEVWIDKEKGIPRQERVKVTYEGPAGSPETVTITLKFFDYNQPVEIR